MPQVLTGASRKYYVILSDPARSDLGLAGGDPEDTRRQWRAAWPAPAAARQTTLAGYLITLN